MVQVYGATETGPIASYQRAAEATQTIGSIGRPAAHVRIRIARADGSECEADEPGEIWVKGPNTFSLYWQDEAATAEALADGWFKTGDVAYRDARGLLWFVGRLKHIIISGGENIYPAEIERLLMTLPGIKELTVVGRPDERWGEVPVVVCAVEPGGPSAKGHTRRLRRTDRAVQTTKRRDFRRRPTQKRPRQGYCRGRQATGAKFDRGLVVTGLDSRPGLVESLAHLCDHVVNLGGLHDQRRREANGVAHSAHNHAVRLCTI